MSLTKKLSLTPTSFISLSLWNKLVLTINFHDMKVASTKISITTEFHRTLQ